MIIWRDIKLMYKIVEEEKDDLKSLHPTLAAYYLQELEKDKEKIEKHVYRFIEQDKCGNKLLLERRTNNNETVYS